MTNLLVKGRNQLSKWLMRSLQAGRVLRIPLLGVTALSTLVTALKNTFLEPYIYIIVSSGALTCVTFIWAYDYFSILNQQNKHNADRSSNFVGPDKTMNKLLEAKQRSVMSRSISQEWSQEKTEKELEKITVKTLQKWRNGIDVDKFYNSKYP